MAWARGQFFCAVALEACSSTGSVAAAGAVSAPTAARAPNRRRAKPSRRIDVFMASLVDLEETGGSLRNAPSRHKPDYLTIKNEHGSDTPFAPGSGVNTLRHGRIPAKPGLARGSACCAR